jgi:acyl-CoA oxidase
MQLVSKSLLSEFREQFNDGGYAGLIRFLAGRFTRSVTEQNPIIIRNTNAEHLLSEEFHKSAFEYREQQLLYTLGQRMRNYIKKRIAPYQAYLRCQNHMISLADAFVENIILKAFYAKIEEVKDEACKNMLIKLCQLFALESMERNKGFYLENDYVSGSKTKAIRRVVSKLCQEIRPDSLGLVEAFHIPEELLGAEIVT